MADCEPADRAVQSMTGSGTAVGDTECGRLAFECRSVNGRGLTVKTRLATECQGLEAAVDQRVRARIRRGTVYVVATVDEAPSNVDAFLDVEFGVQVAVRLEQLAARLGTAVTLADVLAVPGVLPDRSRSGPKRSRPMTPPERVVLDAALDQLVASRAREGQATALAVGDEVTALASALAEVRGIAPGLADEYRAKVLQRVNEFLDGRGRLMEPSEIIREVSVFADRVDIAEEMQRLESHLRKGREMLDGGGVIGRNFEFLVQEMLREVNTLGSKSPDVRIAHLVVQMKSSVDKLKEQAANLE